MGGDPHNAKAADEGRWLTLMSLRPKRRRTPRGVVDAKLTLPGLNAMEQEVCESRGRTGRCK